jgi:uncharacterized protein involved in exopolysaccharide biosynthesis
VSALTAPFRRASRAVWARRWTFGVPVATLLLPATVYAVRQPDVFEAKAFVTLRSVRPENVGAGGALPQKSETRLEHVVTSARNRLLTHGNAAAVAPVLYPDRPLDGAAVNAVKGRVDFDQVGEGAFTVSITDRDASRAARAVNALLDAFLESERRELLVPARRRAEFMERELEKAQAAFADARERYEEFRALHPDSMPDQKDAVVERLRRLESAARDRETQAATSARLAQEYERLLRQSPQQDRSARVATAEEVQLDLQLRGAQTALDQARTEVASARTKYTERHPTLQQLVGEAAALEEAVARTRKDLEAARARGDAAAAERRTVEGRDWIESLERMRLQSVEDQRSAAAEARAARDEMERLQARLAEMPAVEAQLRPLRVAYDEAAKVREDRDRDARYARSAVDYYATTDAADFTGFDVKERAVVPFQPSGPQRWRFLAAAVALGSLAGYLVVALQRRSREGLVLSPDDVESLVPSALVVSVPLLEAPRARRRHALRDVALGAYVVLLVSVAALALAARKGAVPVPEWARHVLGSGA